MKPERYVNGFSRAKGAGPTWVLSKTAHDRATWSYVTGDILVKAVPNRPSMYLPVKVITLTWTGKQWRAWVRGMLDGALTGQTDLENPPCEWAMFLWEQAGSKKTLS